MAFDVKAKIEEIYGKLKSDDKLLKKFWDEPIKTLEGLVGIDLPDDQIQPIVDGLKEKLSADKLGSLASGLFGKK